MKEHHTGEVHGALAAFVESDDLAGEDLGNGSPKDEEEVVAKGEKMTHSWQRDGG